MIGTCLLRYSDQTEKVKIVRHICHVVKCQGLLVHLLSFCYIVFVSCLGICVVTHLEIPDEGKKKEKNI